MSTEAAETGEDAETTEARERLRELPPSAKLAAKILAEEGPLPLAGVAEQSMLPDRTARYAVNRLNDADLLRVGYDPQDARRRVYALRGDHMGRAEGPGRADRGD
jgi:uncharacterized protein (DUF2336 family)